MPLPLTLLRQLQTASPDTAWKSLFDHAWNTCSAPLTLDTAPSEVTKRDAELGAADLFLATAGWDLWRSYEKTVPRTANALESWWAERSVGRAVLILDALSLREVPWLLKGAKERGYTIHQAHATGAELPADTTPFAQALGHASRSALQNDGGVGKGRIRASKTDLMNLPWADCATQITAAQDWLLWHDWLDERVHDLQGPGHGLAALVREAAEQLSSDSFWILVHTLTTGRRLVITADHGYAASGHFPDTGDTTQAQYLKDRFASGRWAKCSGLEQPDVGNWVPPLDLRLTSFHADAAYVLGRRKWKSPGGYPTLTHGGLSILEVVVPFIELSRAGGA
jgi:hypothetical protein